ncbi:MAG: rod shape-determining protein [Nitrosomonadaceae bacterium]
MSDKKTKGILYVGIDFGTSRIAVSASNGMSEHFPSYVGYPKDAISMKVLKKEVLFGQEVIDNRLALNLFRPVEVLKDTSQKDNWTDEEKTTNRKAAVELIRFTIASIKPSADDLVYGVIGLPSEASIHNKKAVVDAAKEAGLDAVIICPEPFAVAYACNQLTNALFIDIGAGSTDLGRMHGALLEPEDQKTLKFAGDYIDNNLYNAMKTHAEVGKASFTIQRVAKIKEQFSSIHSTLEKIMVTLPVQGIPTEFDITTLVRDACKSIVQPILKALQELIASFDPDFQELMRQNVVLCGGGSMIVGLREYFEEELKAYGGGKVTCVETPVFAGSNGALKMAHDMPEDYWQKLS